MNLSAGRSGRVFSKWLQAHSGLEIISRDRSKEYTKGARVGAPHAQQVADRWHLIKDLREAIELFLGQNRHCLRAAGETGVQSEIIESDLIPTREESHITEETRGIYQSQNHSKLTHSEEKRQTIRNKRLERYNKVVELHNHGKPIRDIARRLGLHRTTVRKYIGAGEFPDIAQRRKMPTKLDPYLAYLEERWQAGSRNRLYLWREIREQGFAGTHQLLYGWTHKKGFKKKGNAKELTKDQPLSHKFSTPKARPWAASRAPYLLFLGDKHLKRDERSALHRMIIAEPAVETARTLAQEFRSMLINSQAELLPAWINRARESGISALKSFVNGLEKDLSAVIAAFSLSWSNGPTEGSVNRLKLIKRQMYGRENFDLLRRHVLGLPSDP